MAATPDYPSEWGDTPHRTPTADDYLLADYDRRVARCAPRRRGPLVRLWRWWLNRGVR